MALQDCKLWRVTTEWSDNDSQRHESRTGSIWTVLKQGMSTVPAGDWADSAMRQTGRLVHSSSQQIISQPANGKEDFARWKTHHLRHNAAATLTGWQGSKGDWVITRRAPRDLMDRQVNRVALSPDPTLTWDPHVGRHCNPNKKPWRAICHVMSIQTHENCPHRLFRKWTSKRRWQECKTRSQRTTGSMIQEAKEEFYTPEPLQKLKMEYSARTPAMQNRMVFVCMTMQYASKGAALPFQSMQWEATHSGHMSAVGLSRAAPWAEPEFSWWHDS